MFINLILHSWCSFFLLMLLPTVFFLTFFLYQLPHWFFSCIYFSLILLVFSSVLLTFSSILLTFLLRSLLNSSTCWCPLSGLWLFLPEKCWNIPLAFHLFQYHNFSSWGSSLLWRSHVALPSYVSYISILWFAHHVFQIFLWGFFYWAAFS